MNRYSEIHGKTAKFAARRFGYSLRLKLVRDALKTSGRKPGKLLDIGSAHGDFAGDLMKDGWTVTCLDINLEYLLVGKQRYQEIEFTLGDGQKLPFRDGSFDTVMIQNTLRYVPEPLQVLQESNRVLKSPGELIIIDHNRFSVDTLWARNPEVVQLLTMRKLKQMLIQSSFEILKANYLFIPPASTPRQCLGIVPKLGVLLSRLGLSWIFPEIFIYAIKKASKE
jgi:ubiquinone/menaquinone biosynthesis C-methylase UbiE